MANKKDIYIYTVTGWTYDLKSKNNPFDNGEIVIKFGESQWSGGKATTVSFPLISAWLDPNRQSFMFKAHAAIPHKPQTEEEELALNFARDVLKNSGVEIYNENNRMLVSVDDYMTTLRYGIDSRNGDNYQSKQAEGADRWDFKRYPIFESKGDAMKALLDAIATYSSAKLTGIDLINLAAASDSLLIELGFSKVEDKLGVGIPMWIGDPVRAVNPSSSYSEYSSYRYSGSDYSGIASKSRQEIVEQFVTLLEKELT